MPTPIPHNGAFHSPLRTADFAFAVKGGIYEWSVYRRFVHQTSPYVSPTFWGGTLIFDNFMHIIHKPAPLT